MKKNSFLDNKKGYNGLVQWQMIRWLVLLSLLTFSSYNLVFNGIKLESNLLALLPASEHSQAMRQASKQVSEQLARDHIILLGAKEPAYAKSSAKHLAEQLSGVPGVASIYYRADTNQAKKVAQFYTPYRTMLLDHTSRQTLLDNGGESYISEILPTLYSPLSPFNSDFLRHDPFFLFTNFLQNSGGNAGNISIDDGYLIAEHNNKHYALLRLRFEDSAFALALQQKVLPALDLVLARCQLSFPDLEILDIGVIHYAEAGVSAARSEISTVGVGSTIVISVLLLCTFRSVTTLLVSLLPVAISFFVALSACNFLFGKVHMMTLVFGASLAGIAIDYAFHFLSHRQVQADNWSAKQTVDHIMPAITLGFCSSAMTYLALTITPFPAMQQAAIFSATGLLTAYLTVTCLFPMLLHRPPAGNTPEALLHIADKWQNMLTISANKRRLTLALLLGFALIGISQLQSNDDIRVLQHQPQHLQAQENKITEITGGLQPAGYLMVLGDNAEQVLQREEQTLAELKKLFTASTNSFQTRATSDSVPSIARQQANFALVKQHIIDDPSVIQRYLDATGFEPAQFEQYTKQFDQIPSRFMQIDHWLNNEASQFSRHLWLGETPDGFASLIEISSKTASRNASALQSLAAKSKYLAIIDGADEISDALKSYRMKASSMLIVAYVAVFVLLYLRYGATGAITVLATSAVAFITALSTLGWTGQDLNLFHLLALLLVLGIGIDYALFLRESRQQNPATMFAILLSAITTLAAFGLLALSDTPAISGFGQMVAIGIFLCALLSPMLARGKAKI